MAPTFTARDLASILAPGETILYDSNPNAAASIQRRRLGVLALLFVIPILAFVWIDALMDYLVIAGPTLFGLFAYGHLFWRRVLVTDRRLCHQAHPKARWRSWVYADIERITGIGNSQSRVFALTDRDRDRLWLRRLSRQAEFWQALPAAVKDSRGTGKEMLYYRILQDAVVYCFMVLPFTVGLFIAFCVYLLPLIGPGLGAVQPFLWLTLLLAGLTAAGGATVLLGLWAALHHHRAATNRADAAEVLDFAFDPDVAGRLSWLLRPFRPLYRMILRWVY